LDKTDIDLDPILNRRAAPAFNFIWFTWV